MIPEASETWAYPTSNTTYTVTVDDGTSEVSDEIEIIVYDTPETPTIHRKMVITWYLLKKKEISGATMKVAILREQQISTSSLSIPAHYHVVIINENGCESDMSNGIFYGYTEIDDVEENETRIYPNPFSENTVIEYNMKSQSSLEIILFNSLGKEMKSH
ncbi:MAG: hypothetical protein U5L09_19185 [Bacteroidales bacterium]|nr:hypothetical protein [Bacteroidales bacterium]